MKSDSKIFLLITLLLVPILGAEDISYSEHIYPFLDKHCIECHGGKKVKAKLDFTKIISEEAIKANFESWEEALELIHDGDMPPEERDQPTEQEKELFTKWYKQTFDKVEAHPGFARPRRLSTQEYKNSLRDIFDFELELQTQETDESRTEKSFILKLSPKDPLGRSGFQNDTHGLQFSSADWNRFSYVADKTLEELFSRKEFQKKFFLSDGLKLVSKDQAKQILNYYLPLIYRRPLNSNELAKVEGDLTTSEELPSYVKLELKAALVSPQFLYRGLNIKGEQGTLIPVGDSELAQRLSYFLWGSIPDSELIKLADAGRLNKDSEIQKQIVRMLEEPRSDFFIKDMAAQWFTLDEIDHLGGRLPYDTALKNQPIEFFKYLIKENRPLIELIDSDVTYTNKLMNRFYPKAMGQLKNQRKSTQGIEIIFQPLEKVKLADDSQRGGIITMPGILAMNGVKGRTSPVLRGTWVLERILGDHLPEPPMDVGSVAPNKKGENLSFRERFKAHTTNKTCAVCHDRIDPLGFALESYDSRGDFRTHEMSGSKKKRKKGAKIDASGQMPNGQKFDDYSGLKKILVTSERKTVTRNIVKRFMSYALCRKLELHDKPEVERITNELYEKQGTYHDLIYQVVTSLAFKNTVIKETL